MTKLLAFFLSPALLLAAELNLMPWPAKIALGQGSLPIDHTFQVAIVGNPEARVRAATGRLIAHLSLQTGIPLAGELAQDPSKATLLIQCDHPGEPVQKLGEDESYRLEVTEKQVRLNAENPLGIVRGVETFLQLIAPGQHGFVVPAAIIEDKPRFPWRGLLMDVGRHWIPADVIKRNLDGMAAVKLNIFHWHLSDYQGFRIESKRFPKLHELGSEGLYYTQDQVRDVIAYARDRGIRVVPEFDMPGHSTSWLMGYPELGTVPGPYQLQRTWEVFDTTLDPTRESTYEFLDGFIGEMAALFPDEVFHIGGDEVNGEQWKKSEHIQAFLREHHLKDNRELQAYFNKRVQAILKKYGKRMEGWDEILNSDLPKDIVIQSWRGQESLAEAARLGYSGVLSSGYYLDHMRSAAIHYLVDPLEKESANLTGEQRSRVLGGEACMWGEFATAENVDKGIWPRTAAIAERLWSPPEVRDVASMYRRLEMVSRKLDWLGLTHNSSYHTMLERLAAGDRLGPLKTFADVLEPPEMGLRVETGKYTQQTPLNRLVDAVPAESKTARDFATLVDKMDRSEIRAWLTLWRDNDAKVRPTLENSFLLVEDVPLSEDLSRLGAIGLEALNDIERHEHPTAAWLAEQRTFLEKAGKLHQELLIAIVPSIQKLVDRAAR